MATIIAEFCQNHRGDRGLLGEMIAAAAESGATVAKIQSIRASELTHRPRFDTGATQDGVTTVIARPYAPEYERLRTLDLSFDTQEWFGEACRAAGLEPMTTVFTHGAVDEVARLGWRTVKVASYDCASFELLRRLAGRFDHVYVSTGATYDEEVREAASVFANTQPFSFLHCVTVYPTPLSELHLNRMAFLRQFTPTVGFSDHTLVARDGITASVAALALGATVIERHFTILDADQTKDGPVSIRPHQLRQLADVAAMDEAGRRAAAEALISDWPSVLGQANRALSHTELLNRDYYRGRFASRHDGREIQNWEAWPA